jgi:MFS transporter, Spinster family, sphingosine-1-phosphate transporter
MAMVTVTAADPTSGDDWRKHVAPGARTALILLLLINLFNYIDRQVLAAVEEDIQKELLPSDPNALVRMGSLQTAFLFSYMFAAPIFGWLSDRMSRWLIVGAGVTLWSLASGASGLACSFTILLFTRVMIGLGEAAYGPAAPTLISDMYPASRRGYVLSWFYMAIPVGSALGYVLGGFFASHWGWRTAFYAVVPPGLVLGAWAFLSKEPPRGQADPLAAPPRQATIGDYLVLLKTPSYVLNTLGMTAMTFAIGGIAFWMPRYLNFRGAGADKAKVNLIFGGIMVVAGILATLAGGLAGDALRKRFSGSYFLVSAGGLLLACPFIIAMLFVPFPAAWAVIFFCVFCLFFNTGPSNTILANVTHPSIRATAFAVNILIIHLLGDAISPPVLGKIIGLQQQGWNNAFYLVAGVTALGALFWLLGACFLQRDTERATRSLPDARGFPVEPGRPQP